MFYVSRLWPDFLIAVCSRCQQ